MRKDVSSYPQLVYMGNFERRINYKLSDNNILITNNKQKFSIKIIAFLKPLSKYLPKCLNTLCNVPVNQNPSYKSYVKKYVIHQLVIDMSVEILKNKAKSFRFDSANLLN